MPILWKKVPEMKNEAPEPNPPVWSDIPLFIILMCLVAVCLGLCFPVLRELMLGLFK